MYRTHFYPLRSVTGKPVSVESIFILPHKQKNLSFINRQRINQTSAINDELYSWFLPSILNDGITYTPAQGMATMPIADPAIFPFSSSSPLVSLFAVPKKGKNSNYGGIERDVNPGSLLNSINNSKNFSVTFVFKLEQEALIGGICFGGFPYSPGLIQGRPEGSTLTNQTLPREIRLTPLPGINDAGNPGSFRSHEYLDAEFAHSRQEIISHSGSNFLCIDPVRTNLFALTLSDFPKIITSIDLDGAGNYTAAHPYMRFFYGYAIPYLYFFEYSEKVKTISRLSSGVLGIKKYPHEELVAAASKPFPEYEYFIDENDESGVYMNFSPHSMLGQRRTFLVNEKKKRKSYKESFVSDMLIPGEKFTIYLEQGEEFERCTAGIKLLLAMLPDDELSEKTADKLLALLSNSSADGQLTDAERTTAEDWIATLLGLPVETNFCEKVGLKIFEVDPPDGVSPASIDADSKYATPLAETNVDTAFDLFFAFFLEGIRFKRASSSRYFGIELTNLGEEEGQICIYALQLVRSAHVSVQPRAARRQDIKMLHYRIIGPELADDYSKLGDEGFNFCIDRMIAGQTKNVLYSAMSLLDLMHTGGGRLHSNVRRRAGEFEMTENFREHKLTSIDDYHIKKFPEDDFSGKNLDNRSSEGWKRAETGDGVTFSGMVNPGDIPSSKNESAFESYGSNESRVHSQFLFPDTRDVDWATIGALGNMLKVITDPVHGLQSIISQFQNNGISGLRAFIENLLPNGLLIKTYRSNASANHNTDQLVKDFDRIWRGIDTTANKLRIAGIVSASQSPVGLSAIAGNVLGDVIASLDNLGQVAVDLQALMQTGDITRVGDIINELSGFLDLSIMLGALSITSASGSVSPLAMAPLINGLTLGLTSGVGVNINSGPNLIFPTYQQTANSGSTGNINKTAAKTGYSYSQFLNAGFDQVETLEGEMKRIVSRRELLNRDTERVRGAEILWQGKIQDIITGSLPLNFSLPATAARTYMRTADDSLRVRFNSGFASSVTVDFWFELMEETIQDDY